MFGVIMTWIMLIFVIIGLIFIGRVIQQEDQKSQLSQLQRTTELWAESFSIRLSSDLDRLGQLTESLPQGSSFENVLPRLRVNARALMIDRDEIVEINFVDTSNRVLASFASPHPYGDITLSKGEIYRRTDSNDAIWRTGRNTGRYNKL